MRCPPAPIRLASENVTPASGTRPPAANEGHKYAFSAIAMIRRRAKAQSSANCRTVDLSNNRVAQPLKRSTKGP